MSRPPTAAGRWRGRDRRAGGADAADRLHRRPSKAPPPKSGSGDVPRNDDSAKQYPNLLKECEVLTEDILAKTVGADPLDIQSTFVGAVCRWQAANPAGLIDITRFWFEQGSLDNEKQDRRRS